MASAPPADVEPLRATAHGVVGFAVRPATLYLDSRLVSPYREKLSSLFCAPTRSNSTTPPRVNRIFQRTRRIAGSIANAPAAMRTRYRGRSLLGAPLSRKTAGGKMRSP